MLQDEIEEMLIEDNNPVYDYLTNLSNEATYKNISQKELKSIIFYYFRDDYKGVLGIPLDEKRKDYLEDEINQHYDTLENVLPHFHPSFCFRIDEIGYQEYSDAMEVTVLVRADYSKFTCSCAVDSNYKGATAIRAICTDGEYIELRVVVSRETLEKMIDDFIPLSRFRVVL